MWLCARVRSAAVGGYTRHCYIDTIAKFPYRTSRRIIIVPFASLNTKTCRPVHVHTQICVPRRTRVPVRRVGTADKKTQYSN